MYSKKSYNGGFQIIEVIIASSIIAIIIGVIVAIGVSSTRGINRSADSLLCISLAQHIMELTLSNSFDNIINDNKIYSTYKEADNDLFAGPLFEEFEEINSFSMAIESDLDSDLFEQFKSLNIKYRIQVFDFGDGSRTSFKQVLVSIFWHNGYRELNYNLSGNISRRYDG